jgi:putative FmdB family regulatory protein
MPLYEYQCDACSHRFEVIQKFSDVPIETCPSCGGAVKKLLSSPAIQFKGSGWYITDYARKGQTASGKGDKEGKSDSSGGGESKDASAAKEPAKSETSSTASSAPAKDSSSGKE